MDRPIMPAADAEQAALDRPWRVYASVAVVTFTLVSIGLGFVVLPVTEGAGFDPFASICRAIGIPGYERADARPAPRAAPPASKPASSVAWTSETTRLLAAADVARGEKVVTEVCAACHGEDGVGVDAPYPNLANRPTEALYKQLRDYAAGDRTGGQAEIMTGIATALDRRQMADAAAFYASRSPQDLVTAGSGVSREIEGLATVGDVGRGLAACDSCHGASRSGPIETPSLIGQSTAYLEQQLHLFASGERHNDPFARMRTSAARLTPNEMHRLAIYYHGKPTPRDKD